MNDLLGTAMNLVSRAVAVGGNPKPLAVVARAQAFADAGGELGYTEQAALAHAIYAAANTPDIPAELRKELLALLKKLLALLGYGYPSSKDKGKKYKYPYPKPSSSTKAGESTVEASGSLLHAAEESEGLEWTVCLISSGLSKNGRDYYTKEAIEKAVPLFEGARCFADHAERGVPSVTRLVGWFTNPRLVHRDDGEVEVHAVFHVLESSPFSSILREAWQRGAHNAMGFSIHGNGRVRLEHRPTGTVRVIETIEEVRSVDLVSFPNTDGRLIALRADIFSAADEIEVPADIQLEEVNMDQQVEERAPTPEEEVETPVEGETEEGEVEEREEEETPEAPEAPAAEAATVDPGMLNNIVNELRQLKQQLQRQAVQAQIDALVASSDLPQNILKSVEADLKAADSVEDAKRVLDRARTIWAAAIEEAAGSGFRVRQTSSPDLHIRRLQAMLAGQELESGVQPYPSLRAAWEDITGQSVAEVGPHRFAREVIVASAGFNSEFKATIDTSSWTYALGQAIHREMIRQYKQPGFDDWRKVVSDIANLQDMRTYDRIRIGYYDILPEVGDTYQFLSDPSEERAYYSPTKYGALADFTWEAALNDDLQALRAIPKKLALSAKITVWYNILNIFASAVPPTCSYDSTALFHANHGNLAAADLSAANYAAARKAMMTQTATGNSYLYVGVPPKYLLVPPDLEATARKLRDSDVDIDSTGANVANPWKGTFEIIVIPFWSDSNAWALVADPNLIPTIEVGFLGGKEEPELFSEAPNSGSNFTADKVTYKVRMVFGYCILDHRGMYKSTGSS